MTPMRLIPNRPVDPGARWAEDLLSPLRIEPGSVDFAPAVMRRIAAESSAPLAWALPERWSRLAWAGSLILGCASLVLLTVSVGAMIAAGDPGARALWDMLASSGQVGLQMAGHAGRLAASMLTAFLAFARGGWALIDAAAPLVRGAGSCAAVAGALSIAWSTYVFARSNQALPLAVPTSSHEIDGGVS